MDELKISQTYPGTFARREAGYGRDG